jgi:hypothetical protein
MLVEEVHTALLKYTDYAKAIFGGKITLDQYLPVPDLPGDCRLLRPDLVIRNALAKKMYIFEFACPFAKVYHNGEALKRAYEYKESKYNRLCEHARTKLPGWNI